MQRSGACESKICGCALADKFGLRFEVAQQQHAAVADGFEYRVVVGQTAGNTSDLSWSARAVSKQWMSAPDAESSVARTSGSGGKYLAEWHFVFWLPSSSSSAPSLSYDVEITLTWINDRITGAKWLLPSRDDNPPLAEKKRIFL